MLESGAFGVVKLAKHKSHDLRVALKMVDTEYLAKVDKLRHMEREQELLTVLKH